MAVRGVPDKGTRLGEAAERAEIPGPRSPAEKRSAPIEGAPWLPRGYVPRVLLWSMLDAATQRAMTVVVAPPGAGKTLGVAGWLQQSALGRDAAWISAGASVSPRQLETTLARARAGVETPRLVVVDDAHQLPSRCVRLLDRELNDNPDGVRLVLLTRWDLAMSRLVPELLGHLTVIRGDVLKLSDAEAHRLVAEHARTESTAVSDVIVDRAEGWCAAVVLAARASAAAPSPTEFVRRFRVTGLGVADLVAGEVFPALASRARHLLLCTVSEPLLTPQVAVHLTRDPLAGEVLGTLESTGLLVSRVGDGPVTDGGPAPDESRAQFRIHPLLVEVARRRLNAGGVDVQQARATVLRAVELDLANGDVAEGFRRLVALGEHDLAAEVVATHGPRLLAARVGAHFDTFMRQAGATIEQRPATWATLACGCWMSGDLRGALHWSTRVLQQDAEVRDSLPELQVLYVRLHRARTGLEPVRAAVNAARTAVARTQPVAGGDPFLALVLTEIAAAENWLGDLASAEQHASEAVMVSRAEGLDMVTAEALTHLALTQYMTGREGACIDLAHQAIDLCDTDPGVPGTTRARAETALRLARLQERSWVGPGASTLMAGPQVPDDLAGRFWRQLLSARLALVCGAVAEAQRRLELPSDMPPVPDHLRVSLQLERAMHALTTGNRDELQAAADQLGSMAAAGATAWVEGALADLTGDLRRAAGLYLEASRAEGQPQPATAVLGLVGAAQLHQHLPEAPPVEELLVRAVKATESRRNAVPFLGWSPHGTRVGLLLAQVAEVGDSEWGTELRSTFTDLTGVASIFRPLVGTSRELGSIVEPTVTPTLSPREHEVLGELARGSTYSDIAANLFVSENTVKTHISSLYSKLSVGRRSEALAVARKLHLV